MAHGHVASGCGFSAGADRGYGPGRDGDALPKSELAKAAGYLRNHGELLRQYTCDGCCPIDNNQTEQLMKQIAVGRKNWLFVGSVAGGERAATLMTIVRLGDPQ